jgi:hypothetical protein
MLRTLTRTFFTCSRNKKVPLSIIARHLPLIQAPHRSFSLRFLRQEESEEFNNVHQDFSNISSNSFPKEAIEVLTAPIDVNDVEIKPDGIIFLPEIKYRRILNKAFGPGGWALAPRGKYQKHNNNIVSQEYALFCLGQYIGQAFGEQTFGIGLKTIATALEGAKSNALMRCCKDIGIASELWDPNFIREWKKNHAVSVWCENQKTKQRKLLYRRKDRPPFEYPFKEVGEQTKSKSNVRVESEEDLLDDTELNNDLSNVDESVPIKKTYKNHQFGPNVKIAFGKYKGQTWSEAMKDPEFENYLNFLIGQGKTGPLTDMANEALAYIKKQV